MCSKVFQRAQPQQNNSCCVIWQPDFCFVSLPVLFYEEIDCNSLASRFKTPHSYCRICRLLARRHVCGSAVCFRMTESKVLVCCQFEIHYSVGPFDLNPGVMGILGPFGGEMLIVFVRDVKFAHFLNQLDCRCFSTRRRIHVGVFWWVISNLTHVCMEEHIRPAKPH